jgi:hypothetical protein
MSVVGFLTVFVGSAALATLGTGKTSAVHAPPNACTVLTVAEVSTAIGRPASGGTISTYDNPASTSASCQYTAAPLTVMVIVSQYASPAAAKQGFTDELTDTRGRDSDSQHTIDESGVGDAAFSFSMTVGAEMVGWTAVHGPRKISIAVLGKGAAAVTHDHLRTLMLGALAR